MVGENCHRIISKLKNYEGENNGMTTVLGGTASVRRHLSKNKPRVRGLASDTSQGVSQKSGKKIKEKIERRSGLDQKRGYRGGWIFRLGAEKGDGKNESGNLSRGSQPFLAGFDVRKKKLRKNDRIIPNKPPKCEKLAPTVTA